MGWRKENFGAARTTTNRAYSRRKPRQIEVAGDSGKQEEEEEEEALDVASSAQLLHWAMACGFGGVVSSATSFYSFVYYV